MNSADDLKYIYASLINIIFQIVNRWGILLIISHKQQTMISNLGWNSILS